MSNDEIVDLVTQLKALGATRVRHGEFEVELYAVMPAAPVVAPQTHAEWEDEQKRVKEELERDLFAGA